jgi:hypothetical protein
MKWVLPLSFLVYVNAVLAASDGSVVFENDRAVPKLLNYQGYVTDSSGVPINNDLDMTFAIYDQESGGTSLWSETQTDITVENGVFSVLLGSGTSLPVNVFTDNDCWLELTLEGTQTLSPRTRIISVGYSYTASYADSASCAENADSLDGENGSFYRDASNINAGTLPDARLSGNVSLLGQSVESSEITNGTILNDDINTGAGIDPAKISGTAWTSTNDGSGSGLDADMVDGTHIQCRDAHTAFSEVILDIPWVEIETFGSVHYLRFVNTGTDGFAYWMSINNNTATVGQTFPGDTVTTGQILPNQSIEIMCSLYPSNIHSQVYFVGQNLAGRIKGFVIYDP